jgi:hypothetical protein
MYIFVKRLACFAVLNIPGTITNSLNIPLPHFSQQLDDLVFAMDMRFSFSILILCVPILSFLGIIGIVVYAVKGNRGNEKSGNSEGAYDGV